MFEHSDNSTKVKVEPKKFDYLNLIGRDVSFYRRGQKFCLLPIDFLSALAYWVTRQNPNPGFVVGNSIASSSFSEKGYFVCDLLILKVLLIDRIISA
jgi:hypothetical protein